MKTILGIDPGTATTGWGVVRGEGQDLALVEYGTIRTPANTPLPERLLAIHREVTTLLETFEPDLVAVEQVFFQKNVKTAMMVGHARGVVLLAAANAGLPIDEFTPNEIKQAVTGYGAADKQQMQDMVRMLLGLDSVPRPDDAADAVAAAICSHHTVRYL